MDAVLPLTLRDVDRASLLLRSLEGRFERLGTLWVVCPDHEAPAIEAALARLTPRYALRVEREAELVPELALAPRLRGWFRQQLIKLAIHERVETDFYLTLDADVICTRRVAPESLAPEGRGLCHVIPRDLHADWYRGSEAVLGIANARRGGLHAVTPAVLNRRAVAELAAYLEGRAESGLFASGLRGLRQRWLFFRAKRTESRHFAAWRLLLTAGAPWTEYALYYTFLEATGRFERFHRYSADCIYDVERSVWFADRSDFGSWDPEPIFRGLGPPWFVVVQSNTRIAPAEVSRKLGRYLADA
jgi:hypothetical protein